MPAVLKPLDQNHDMRDDSIYRNHKIYVRFFLTYTVPLDYNRTRKKDNTSFR